MKDNLEGRIIGFHSDYRLDPSQVEPGESLHAKRTVWADVTDHTGDFLFTTCRHTGEEWFMPATHAHTVMPAGYPNSNS